MITRRILTAMAVLAVMLFANTKVMAQNEDAREEPLWDICEEMPEYFGGMDSLRSYLSHNINYPEEAKEKELSGRVYIQFVIEKDGSVNDVKVMRSVDPLLDNEAVRVVKAMPKWKPGIEKGKPVRVKYVLPIIFKLT